MAPARTRSSRAFSKAGGSLTAIPIDSVPLAGTSLAATSALTSLALYSASYMALPFISSPQSGRARKIPMAEDRQVVQAVLDPPHQLGRVAECDSRLSK